MVSVRYVCGEWDAKVKFDYLVCRIVDSEIGRVILKGEFESDLYFFDCMFMKGGNIGFVNFVRKVFSDDLFLFGIVDLGI